MTHVLVILESPFAGLVDRNLRYLRACMRDCILRGEAPFASHGLYTQPGVLDDGNPQERSMGIAAGFAWRAAAVKTVVYEDLGITPGMEAGITHAMSMGQPIERRALAGWELAMPCETCGGTGIAGSKTGKGECWVCGGRGDQAGVEEVKRIEARRAEIAMATHDSSCPCCGGLR